MSSLKQDIHEYIENADAAAGMMDLYNDANDMFRTIDVGLSPQTWQALPQLVPVMPKGLGKQAEMLDDAMPQAGPGMEAFGTAMDVLSVGKGLYHLNEATSGDEAMDDVAAVDAVHDLIDGGAGLLSTYGGPIAAPLAGAFAGGFAVGDMIAPLIFGSEATDPTSIPLDLDSEDHAFEPGVPFDPHAESSEFKPSCGNDTIDTVVSFISSLF